METENTYKSFNENKSIEELQYNMFQHRLKLKDLLDNNQFITYLLKASIYKQGTLNLFETLEKYKEHTNEMETLASNILDEVNSHSKQIKNKIEGEDIACDTFFIKKHDDLELKIHKLFIESRTSKRHMFQYLKSVINFT